MSPEPLTLKRILVPIDFSDPATTALRQAAMLGGATGAEILLLYIIEPIAYPAELGVVVNLESDLEDRAQLELERLRDRYLSDYSHCECLVEQGVPDVEILEVARRRAVDMIVIGTHGHSGFKHLLLGSTAERVVRAARCPVLTVHYPDD